MKGTGTSRQNMVKPAGCPFPLPQLKTAKASV
jgi:hypothetical protein